MSVCGRTSNPLNQAQLCFMVEAHSGTCEVHGILLPDSVSVPTPRLLVHTSIASVAKHFCVKLVYTESPIRQGC